MRLTERKIKFRNTILCHLSEREFKCGHQDESDVHYDINDIQNDKNYIKYKRQLSI